jgi:hypothetical protein
LGIAVVLLAIFYFLHWWNGPLRYLQFHAGDIHDFIDQSPGWTGDFSRRISAQCSEDVFHRYAAQQGLTNRLEISTSVQLGWGACPHNWWTPPKNLKGAYYSYKDGGSRHLLAYDGRRLYYDIEVW